jgi:hypothetical protein
MIMPVMNLHLLHCLLPGILLGLATHLHAQLEWRDRHIQPTTLLVDAAHHDGLTVAVGSRSSYGYIHTTTDVVAAEWTEHPYFDPPTFNIVPLGVAYFAGQWVVVDSNGGWATSGDLQNWNRGFAGTFDLTSPRAWNGRLFVAGRNGITSTSDGVNWDFVTITTEFTEFTDIAHGAGVYVAVGRAQAKGVLYTSANAVDWTPVYQVADNINMIYSVDYADGRFVAAGNRGLVMTSTNGMDWIFPPQTGVSGTMMYVRHVHGRWLLAGTNLVYASADGITFGAENITRPSGRSGTLYRPLAAGDLSVVVGQNGMVFTLGEPAEPPVFTTLPEPIALAAGAGTFYSASASGYPSDITFTWHWLGEEIVRPTTGSTIKTSSLQLTAPVASTTISIVASSSGGSVNSGPITVPVVESGPWDVWEQFADVIAGVNFSGPGAYGNGRFVIAWNMSGAAPGGVYSSADGHNWTSVQLVPTYYISALKFLNGRFVAASYSGEVLHSEDGINWSSPVAVITEGGEHARALTSLAWFKGYYFATHSQKVYRSTDLAIWEPVDNAELSLISGFFEHAGALHGLRNSSGAIHMTHDGVNWEPSTLVNPASMLLYGIAYGNGRFVAGRNAGMISYSDDGVNWTDVNLARSGAGTGAVYFVDGQFICGTNLSSADGATWVRRNASGGTLVIGGGQRLIATGWSVFMGSLASSFLLDASEPVGGGWHASDLLGLFNYIDDNHVFHAEYGWLFTGANGNSAAGAWCYQPDAGTWQWFTSAVGSAFSYFPGDSAWFGWDAAAAVWQRLGP